MLPALPRKLSEVIADYDAKVAAIPAAVAAFEAAGVALKTAATLEGQWGNVTIDTGHVSAETLRRSLVRSAWRYTYNALQIDRIASAKDKRLFEQAMEDPPRFTVDNLRATFGPYLMNPRQNILRGLAEVFVDLDPAYKSHDRVKIGVDGLPKRIIIGSVGSYGSWGMDKLRDVLNALEAYRGKPLLDHADLGQISSLHSYFRPTAAEVTIRGLRIKKFQNGNAHVVFDPASRADINRALAEFYGDVLPDTHEEGPDKPAASTAVSKDLQYYPTPQRVVDEVVQDLNLKGKRVLEPSCGCGRFMDALRKAGAKPYGIEVDPGRAAECRAKGHNVLLANFLETAPTGDYDVVVMNPPFYGKHYAKHVQHALKFLRPGGVLKAVLPATARYDHGLLDGRWEDLPVGSFSESGTNINTTVLTAYVADVRHQAA